MERRRIGSQGLEVSAIGLGCMGMSDFYGPREEAESLATIDLALELGVTLLDTAATYGPFTNEELVGKAIKGRRDEFEIATKFGIVRSDVEAIDDYWRTRRVDGRPEFVKASCEGSLQRLGVETIDLLYQHRVDPDVPIEETVGAMAELVVAGKVRYLGLSEASPETIRRAHAVHPITALQSEYSLWTRGIEQEILPTLRELGIGFVAYSPLGRGMLAGRFHAREDMSADDWRLTNPRFSEENFERNRRLVIELERLAAEKRIKAPQLALAWLLSRGDDIVPIPGTKRSKYLRQNAEAASIELSPAELERLEEVFTPGVAAGDRYPDMSGVER